MKIKNLLITLFVPFFLIPGISFGDYKCLFSEGGWNPDDWLIVKSPRWDYAGSWIQEKDHIANKVPSDASREEMLEKRAGETYTSMILKEKFRGSVEISSTISFADRMAPLIVIANDYGKDSGNRPEHRDHLEVVLYEKGINVWHHYFKDGKLFTRKAAFMKTPFIANEKYLLAVKIEPNGKGAMITVGAGGKTFGFFDESFPESFHAGITGCEGVNHFYDFSVRQLKLK